MAILEEFFPLKRDAIKPGPDRLQLLMQDAQGQEALHRPSVLVVGTNGKGTTSLFLEAFLLRSRFRVGTYTSPHFVDPLERIRINGHNVDAELALRARDIVLRWRDKHLPDASFFEITTAIALLCFAWTPCDIVILEAGLGGRLDSTNAASPLLTVLTSIGLDHMDRLGHSLESIAFEKAMATRRHRPLVSGCLNPEACLGVHRALERTGAHWIPLATTPEEPTDGDPLPPRQRNAATAWTALKTLAVELRRHHYDRLAMQLSETLQMFPDAEAAAAWFQTIPLPGRFDVRRWGRLDLVLDTAHNPAAAMGLVREWQHAQSDRASGAAPQSQDHQPALVFGSLKDKDYKETFRILASQCHKGLVVTFDHESSLNAKEAKDLVKEFAANRSFDIASVKELGAWLRAHEIAHEQSLPKAQAKVIITGSFALIGQVMNELQLMPVTGGGL
jgi:dihydrofolate synthase/folylpolyglutamate synthase